jgi:3-deoxy-manno-octulosonate cytidylyltransferase (CMP-KDO synthetase)
MLDYILVIPARLQSTRLPNKLLIKINKKTVLERVWEKCVKAVGKNKVYVATGDKKILDFCKIMKINTVLTSKNCLTGTDRIYEVSKKIIARIYINVQGDEIFVRPKSIKKVINYCKKNRNNFVVNAYTDIKNEEEFRSSSVPKIIIDNKNNLLFVTRSPSPTNKKFNFIKAFKQVCIYAYPRNSLLKLKKNKKGFLERIEDIEILRFVENGIKVKMIKVQGSELAIDEKKDVIAAIKLFDKNE